MKIIWKVGFEISMSAEKGNFAARYSFPRMENEMEFQKKRACGLRLAISKLDHWTFYTYTLFVI